MDCQSEILLSATISVVNLAKATDFPAAKALRLWDWQDQPTFIATNNQCFVICTADETPEGCLEHSIIQAVSILGGGGT